jgi:hypothetical protein
MSRILGCRIDQLDTDADYEAIKKILTTFHKQGDDRAWDEYRRKVSPESILPIIEKILSECERNGFIGPRVDYKGKIVWQQILANGDYFNLDQCTLCYRPCERREEIDTGEAKRKRQHQRNYREPAPCWEGNHVNP